MAQDGPEMARYGPRTAQVGSKVAQDDPKMAPRCVKMGSSWPPIALRFLVSHCEIYLKTQVNAHATAHPGQHDGFLGRNFDPRTRGTAEDALVVAI